MSKTIKGSLPGLNIRGNSKSLLVLQGSGFQDGDQVTVTYNGKGGTPFTWVSTSKTKAHMGGQILIARLTPKKKPEDHPISDPPGVSDVSVTVTDGSPTPPTATIVADIYDEDDAVI